MEQRRTYKEVTETASSSVPRVSIRMASSTVTVGTTKRRYSVRLIGVDGRLRVRPKSRQPTISGSTTCGPTSSGRVKSLDQDRAPSVSSCATIARIAAIAPTKQTQGGLPRWHCAALIKASVKLEIAEKGNGIEHKTAIKPSGRTGFEMALLTNASLMVLTIYDMAKAVILARIASGIELRLKVGGRSA